MGKLLQCDAPPVLESFPQQCHNPPVDPWRDSPLQLSLPPPPPSSSSSSSPSSSPPSPHHSPLFPPLSSWDSVPGLESQQVHALLKLAAKGVFWKHPSKPLSSVFTLHHGGDVEADGNCLFSAAQKAMSLNDDSPQSIRKKIVQRFIQDYRSGILTKSETDRAIKHLYSPDLSSGWGVHVVQEVKLLAGKVDRETIDSAIEEMVQCGVSGDVAAETVYKERCLGVDNGESWAKYMSVAGDVNDEHDIITLMYAQDGLISIDDNREGRAAAFGDDIAIESLASEYHREIFVVQAHGSDAMIDDEHCVFFLSHKPRGEIQHHPVFLFMKGTGWCGSGADHYEPLIAQPAPQMLQEKAALVL